MLHRITLRCIRRASTACGSSGAPSAATSNARVINLDMLVFSWSRVSSGSRVRLRERIPLSEHPAHIGVENRAREAAVAHTAEKQEAIAKRHIPEPRIVESKHRAFRPFALEEVADFPGVLSVGQNVECRA